MVRTSSIDENGKKKGTWSEEEDRKLKAYIERYGHWNWRQLPKFAGVARCGKSCRLRWMNYLRPGLKRGNYTAEEENLIIKLHDKLGNKWSAIAAKLSGRTDNEIKNYWHTNLKTRLKNFQATKENVAHSTEISPSEASQETQPPEVSQVEFTAETSSALESPEKFHPSAMISSSESSTSRSNSNWAAEDGISSWESIAEPIENFWTEPFVLDTSFNYFSSFDGEGELASYTSYLDDGTDFLYQWLQDHPEHTHG